LIGEIDGPKKLQFSVHKIENFEAFFSRVLVCFCFSFGDFEFSVPMLFLAERIIEADCPKDGKAAADKPFIILYWRAH
jgi:hypothetical protein